MHEQAVGVTGLVSPLLGRDAAIQKLGPPSCCLGWRVPDLTLHASCFATRLPNVLTGLFGLKQIHQLKFFACSLGNLLLGKDYTWPGSLEDDRRRSIHHLCPTRLISSLLASGIRMAKHSHFSLP